MRPLNLKISAFGPYAGEVKINMQELGESGLYLISGDTGSGKTTIFDALAFALYGEASGEQRENTMLRSKYAAADTPTYVELTFQYGDKTYQINRNPEYERLSKRGEGTTTQRAEAELHLPDGSIVSKVTDVTNKIEEILGLSKEQFSQIAMIAQGDFLKLLLASTEERKKIFRKLFRTDNYQKLQDELRVQANQLRNNYERVSDQQKQLLKRLVCPENSIYYQKFNELQDKEVLLSETLDLLESILEEDKTKNEKLNKEQSSNDSKLSQLDKQLGVIETREKSKQELETTKQEVELKTLELKEIAKEFSLAENKQQEVPALDKKITLEKDKLSKYDELEELSKKLKETEDVLNKQITTVETKATAHKELGRTIEEKEKQLEKHKDIELLVQKYQQEEKDQQRYSESLETLNDTYQRLSLSNKNLKILQKNYQQKSEEHIKQHGEYQHRQQAFLDGQAGILAVTLQDNLPCPVCGSLDHPRPATHNDETISEEALNVLKLLVDKLDKEVKALSVEAGQLKGSRDSLQEQLRQQLKTLKLEADEANLPTIIAAELNSTKIKQVELNKSLEQLDNLKNQRNKLQEELPKSRAEAENLLKEIQELKVSNELSRQAINTLSQEISKQKVGLEYPDKEQAVLHISKLETEKKAIQDTFDNVVKRRDSIHMELNRLNERIRVLSEQIKGDVGGDKQELLQQKELLETKKKELSQQLQLINNRLTNNKVVKEEIIAKSTEIDNVLKQWQTMQTLSDTASGNISGQEKIMLETYVQMSYFDRVLARANTRFMKMTSGQYELIRRKEAGNLRSQSGLDIDVIDYYNDSIRSVKTLSGGESFMASLSLALGLADEIQSSAGGIRLDTMFIDEGFGSLDEDSLQQAISVLNELTEGHRLVGIISHVGELKRRIDKQINVYKDRSGGSRVEVVV